MEVKPINDYVLIEQDPFLLETDTGLVLPEQVDQTPPPTGTIYAVHADAPLKQGDKVLFKPHMFDSLTLSDKTYLCGSHTNVVAILNA